MTNTRSSNLQPIIFEQIKYTRRDFHLDVNLSLPGSKLSVILGPSGGGKTTLLDVCAGFLSPDSGRILQGKLDITPLLPEKRRIGFVFQDHALFPHLSVVGNVAFGPRMRGFNRKESLRIAHEKLTLVEMENLVGRRPDDLSGGESQRVALARALATDPDILLLDEPFSSLDASLRLKMCREVRRIISSTGVTALLVTHDQEEALTMADYLAVMNEGHITRSGLPSEVWFNPIDPFTASFLGKKSWLIIQEIIKNPRGELTALTSAGEIPLPETQNKVSLPAILMIRPDSLISRKNGILKGQLVHLEFTSTGWRLELKPANSLENDLLTAHWPDTEPPRIGDVLSFDVKINGMRVIEKTTQSA